ncbi:hypothetical protein AB0P40_37430, partial [Streptomyces sp. NPDC079189]
ASSSAFLKCSAAFTRKSPYRRKPHEVLAIIAGGEAVGPFAGHTVLEVMLNLAVLNGSVALTALLLAAIVTEKMDIRRRIEQACVELADVVDHLAPGRSATAWPSRYKERHDGL